MTIRLNGQTSGYVELEAPDNAGSNTLVLPDGNGSSGQYLQTNGSGTLSWQTVNASNLTRGTAITTTSGTSAAFHNIPSNARRIVLMFDRVSLNTAEEMRIQVGTGTQASPSWVTANYVAARGYSFYNNTASADGNASTSGFRFNYAASSFFFSGRVVLENLSGNTWVESGVVAGGETTNFALFTSGGVVDAGATVTQVRVIGNSGTSTFDNGQINIIYEV